ncbi:MAG: 1-acyl-sn-glycerol-3-phosphate acyltransferase [Cyanothece sp. SIO1E1]|nr:1-acyl-sn-glycerol-3-phosphate acyltransferase [Cyanothece sp. SIO1E1]
MSNRDLLTRSIDGVQAAIQALIWVSGTLIYKYWFQLDCQGLENLPRDRGYIIAANHTSHLDGPAIVAAQGQPHNHVYSLAAADYFFNHPSKGWICRNCFNMVPFKRRGKFLNCLPTCQDLIAHKKCILFFPEGTRSLTGELQPLKLGLGRLVLSLNVLVVPAYIQGTYEALPKGQYFPKRHPIQVSFGPPLDFTHYQAQPHELGQHHQIYRDIVNDVYRAIQHLSHLSPELVTTYPAAPAEFIRRGI